MPCRHPYSFYPNILPTPCWMSSCSVSPIPCTPPLKMLTSYIGKRNRSSLDTVRYLNVRPTDAAPRRFLFRPPVRYLTVSKAHRCWQETNAMKGGWDNLAAERQTPTAAADWLTGLSIMLSIDHAMAIIWPHPAQRPIVSLRSVYEESD